MNQIESVNKIGQAVKMLRERKGLAQWQLATNVGLTQSMISHIENGDRNPSIDVVAKLATYFDVTIDSLYKGQVEVPVI